MTDGSKKIIFPNLINLETGFYFQIGIINAQNIAYFLYKITNVINFVDMHR